MKMDVEGFEPFVVDGARTTLRERPPRVVLTEYTPGVVESREAAAGHNGVLLEGPSAFETLRVARREQLCTSEAPPPGRFRLLRVLTRTDLQQAEEQRFRTQVALGLVVGLVGLTIAHVVGKRARS